MRLFLCITIALFLAADSTAQTNITQRISKQTVASVLNLWSEDYDIDFAFDSYELSNYVFSGVFDATPVDEALARLLKETPYQFRWLNNTCIIFPAPLAELTQAPTNLQPNTFSGVVRDRLNGETLPFAAIAALNAGAYTTTDADGKFVLIYEGPVVNDTLAVNYLGYVNFRLPFTWSEKNKTAIVELVAAHALLPDVDIRATSVKPMLFESTPSTITINPNLSGLRFGVGESDVFRLAHFVPGVSGVQENSNGLFIRGSASDQSQLLFDGFNIYHQDHFFGMFSSINSYAVKSMRVYKCLADASQGGRAAGAVELVGREGDLRRPSARIELGTMSISGSLETPLDTTGKASLFLCGRRSIVEWLKGPAYNELFRTLYSATIVSDGNDQTEASTEKFDPQLLFQDLNAKFTYRPSGRHQVNLSFYASRDEMSFAYADTSGAELLNVSDIRYSDEATKANRGASARWIHQLTPRLEVLTSVGYSSFQGFYFSTDSIRNNLFATDSAQFSYRDVLLHDWSALHRWQRKSSNHLLKWGVSFNHISIINKERTSANSDKTISTAGFVATAFIGDEWTLSRLVLQPGVRINSYSNDASKLAWEPKISARYRLLGRELFLKAAAVRSFQFVQRITNQSLYQNVPDQWQLADSVFPVMHADHALLGVNWTRGKWNIDLEAYYKRTQGQVLNASAGQYTNAGFDGYYSGVAIARGFDAAVQWEQAPHRLLVCYSQLYAVSDYDDFEQRFVAESYNRAAEGKMVYEWKKGPWNIALVVLAAQGAPYTKLEGSYNYSLPDGSASVFPVFGGYNRATTAPYFRSDISAGCNWQWNKMRWQLGVSVYNVLNTPNYRAVQYSVARTDQNSVNINQREIRMLGRIPSINITCQF
jgi:ferric enterobactin receptor